MKTLALALLALALLPLAASAAETPAVAAPSSMSPAQPDLALDLGVPRPHEVSACSDICVADFKICRDSCHSLACYNACRDALDQCLAGC